MRGRSCVALCLLAHLACGPPGEPPEGPAVALEPRPAQDSPGPPTTLRLVLQLQPDGSVRLISSDARRGSIDEPPEPAVIQDAIERRLRLVEYTARDGAGGVVATGRFTVPATAVAEFQDPDAETRIRRAEEPLATPTVKVSIPYHPSAATISFEQLEPTPDAPVEAWKRTPLGEVSVPRSPAPPGPQQQQQEQRPPAQQR